MWDTESMLRAPWGRLCQLCVCVCVPCRVEVCRPYPRVGDGYPKKMAQRNMDEVRNGIWPGVDRVGVPPEAL